MVLANPTSKAFYFCILCEDEDAARWKHTHVRTHTYAHTHIHNYHVPDTAIYAMVIHLEISLPIFLYTLPAHKCMHTDSTYKSLASCCPIVQAQYTNPIIDLKPYHLWIHTSCAPTMMQDQVHQSSLSIARSNRLIGNIIKLKPLSFGDTHVLRTDHDARLSPSIKPFYCTLKQAHW